MNVKKYKRLVPTTSRFYMKTVKVYTINEAQKHKKRTTTER